MNVALLDVSVLLALFWPRHVFHAPASQWFHAHRNQGWATCSVTQAGFARVSAQPKVVPMGATVEEALDVLAENCAAADHVYWTMEFPVTHLLPEIRACIASHKQLTDAILLDLAIRRGARLITLDRSLPRLLPPGSQHAHAVDVLST